MTANEKLTPTLTPQQLAEQVRFNHRSFNSPDAAEPHPAPKIVGLVGDGLVPKVLLDQTDVEVVVESLNEYHEGDKAKLQLLDPTTSPPSIVYESPQKDLPKDSTGYPQYLSIPSTELKDSDKVHPATAYQVIFIVEQGDTGNDIPSKPLAIGVDSHSPGQSKHDGTFVRLDKPEVLNVPGDIDEDWLIRNTHMELRLALDYQFHSLSDWFDISISTAEPGADGPLPNKVYSGNLAADGKVKIRVEDFEDQVKNDGPIYVGYTSTDESGNVSKVSFVTLLNVLLRPKPEFKKVRIPIVGEEGTLNYKTLESKIYAYVDRGKNWRDTDKILLKLRRTSDGTTFDVAELPVGTDNLLRFELIYLILKLLPINDETPADTELFYELIRGVETPIPSPETAFITDFTKAGPGNPNLPSLTNPKMVKVGLKGKSGTLNHVTGADRGEPVTIETPMKNPGDPWVILGSEAAALWYNGVKVYELALTGTETKLTFDIPSATIDSGGTGKKSAWWTIQGDMSSNTWSSEKTEVTVDAAIVEFPAPSAPTFTITDNGNKIEVVNCKSLTVVGTDRQLEVTVPLDTTYMPLNSTVVVHSIGTSDRLGFQPILGTDFSEPHTITAGDVTAGQFKVRIKPYLTKIKPIQPTQQSGQLNGAIKIWYVVQVNNVSVPSDEFLHEVRLLASGLYCEGTPTL